MLRGIDLDVAPGEIVAVCGGDRLGKSTLLNLLPRFYDPTAGRVLLGGVDVRDVSLADLRDAVAVITQRPILFSITLRENLTAGRPDAPWDEVEAMCRRRRRHRLRPTTCPDGYDTLIGERGVNLSGGQRQRVALARALIAGRPRDRARRPAVGGRHAHRARAGRRGCGRRSRAAPCWSPRSGCRPSSWPTARSVLRGRPRSSRTGRPPSCSRRRRLRRPVRRRDRCRVAAHRPHPARPLPAGPLAARGLD